MWSCGASESSITVADRKPAPSDDPVLEAQNLLDVITQVATVFVWGFVFLQMPCNGAVSMGALHTV